MPYFLGSDPVTGSLVIYRPGEGTLTSFGEDPANSDYQAYLAWLAEGNTPQPWPPAE